MCNPTCVNGLCTQPNQCSCQPGWFGASCTQGNHFSSFSCFLLDYFDRLAICTVTCVFGSCTRPNLCTSVSGKILCMFLFNVVLDVYPDIMARRVQRVSFSSIDFYQKISSCDFSYLFTIVCQWKLYSTQQLHVRYLFEIVVESIVVFQCRCQPGWTGADCNTGGDYSISFMFCRYLTS